MSAKEQLTAHSRGRTAVDPRVAGACSATDDKDGNGAKENLSNAGRIFAKMSQKVSGDLGLPATNSNVYGTKAEEMSDNSSSGFSKRPVWSEDEDSVASTEKEKTEWKDPRLVPPIKKRRIQSEPLPDTFFGKLHQNSPLTYRADEWRAMLAESDDSDLEDNKENKASKEETATPRQVSKKVMEKATEQYCPEFPALFTPQSTRKLSARNLERIRRMSSADVSHMSKWIYAQSFHVHESKPMVVETLMVRDESEEEPNEPPAPAGGSPSVDNPDDLDATTKQLQRLQLKEAIPECCLTDSVFLVDKPQTAVSLGFELPSMPFEDIFQEGAYLKIRVCHVYSPFQLWFHLVSHVYDSAALDEMHISLRNVYIDPKLGYSTALPDCMLKAGYVCATPFEDTWRRAKILATPPPGVATVSIYYLDYGYGADVAAADLRYLPSTFGIMPALAFRGTLSYIHPLGPHWSPDAKEPLKRLIVNEELFAHVTELDFQERIVFMRISQNKEFTPSINQLLVEAKLAGKSRHYDPQAIQNNNGRRQRYLRERLPSHEMLETRVFPVLGEEFETEFDCVLYSPSFEEFKVPRLRKPYNGLWQALDAWMSAYRKETEQWDRLYSEACAKLRADYAVAKKKERK